MTKRCTCNTGACAIQTPRKSTIHRGKKRCIVCLAGAFLHRLRLDSFFLVDIGIYFQSYFVHTCSIGSSESPCLATNRHAKEILPRIFSLSTLKNISYGNSQHSCRSGQHRRKFSESANGNNPCLLFMSVRSTPNYAQNPVSPPFSISPSSTNIYHSHNMSRFLTHSLSSSSPTPPIPPSSTRLLKTSSTGPSIICTAQETRSTSSMSSLSQCPKLSVGSGLWTASSQLNLILRQI